MTPRLDARISILAEKRRQLLNAQHAVDSAAADRKGGPDTFEQRWQKYELATSTLNSARIDYDDAVREVLAAWAEEPRR